MLLAALLAVCAALLYLDWRRQGELELLHVRVDALERRAVGKSASPPAGDGRRSRSPHHPDGSTVERILRASDDRTLADIAREGAR